MSETNEAPQGSAGLLSKEQIKANAKLAHGYIMAFGGRVRVIELDAKGRNGLQRFAEKLRERLEKDGIADDALDGMMAEFSTPIWLMHCMVDDDNKRVWADADLDDVANLPGADSRRVFKLIAKLNGLDRDDEDDAPNS